MFQRLLGTMFFFSHTPQLTRLRRHAQLLGRVGFGVASSQADVLHHIIIIDRYWYTHMYPSMNILREAVGIRLLKFSWLL